MSAHNKNEEAKQILESAKKGYTWWQHLPNVDIHIKIATNFLDETQKDVDVIINLLQHEWKHKYSSDSKPESPPLLDKPPPSRPIPDNIPELMKDLEIGDTEDRAIKKTPQGQRGMFYFQKWRQEGLYGGWPFMSRHNGLKELTEEREQEIQGANRANWIAYFDRLLNNVQADVDTIINLLQIEWRKIYT